MNDHELMATLAGADPARGVDLQRIDPQAWRALRDGTPLTTRPDRGRAGRRRYRRAVLSVGLAVALAGGGAAYALTRYQDWYSGTGGALDGLTCMTTWQDAPTTNGLDTYGGVPMSDDPVADCAEYARLIGRAPITDPIAVRWDDVLVVGPRAGRPAAAQPVGSQDSASAATTSRVRELESSLLDLVDGGRSRCFDDSAGSAFATDELTRLGLADWSVQVDGPVSRGTDHCVSFVVDEGSRQVRVLVGAGGQEGAADGSGGAARPAVEQLRTQVATRCLGLAEATQVTAGILGTDEHHWPTATTVDPGASCTRVDVVVGGSVQVFLYGP